MRHKLVNFTRGSQLIGHFGARVYSTLIPRNVRLAEAPSHGQGILRYELPQGAKEAPSCCLALIGPWPILPGLLHEHPPGGYSGNLKP